jgi:hypothetical protein
MSFLGHGQEYFDPASYSNLFAFQEVVDVLPIRLSRQPLLTLLTEHSIYFRNLAV